VIASLATSTSEPERRPSGARAEAREQAILDAALELILEVGYDRLSMDALAERAHAGKATIYRHWSGKAEVVAEAMRCRVATKHAAPPETGSLRGDLLGMVGEMVKSMTQEDGALVAGVLWAMRTDPVLAGLVRAQIVEQKQEVARVTIQRAIERGELAPTADPQIVAEVLPAMVFMRLLVTGEPLDEKFFIHVIDSILIPSLKGNV
jgi:AcrR family transcriptional regulator